MRYLIILFSVGPIKTNYRADFHVLYACLVCIYILMLGSFVLNVFFLYLRYYLNR